MDWSEIIKIIKKYNSFAISAHIGLEGDAVGSEIAFSRLLKNLGKRSVIINHDKTIPQSLHFLISDEIILNANDPQCGEIVDGIDVIVILDVCNWDHLGSTAVHFRNKNKPIICIDHHKCSSAIGDYVLTDDTACAAGILIYDLIKQFPANICDNTIETAVYTAILTDTGNFRFSNTDAKAYRAAAELLERGVDHNLVCTNVYESNSWARLRLLRYILGTLTCEDNGKIAWIKITSDMLKKANASIIDSDGAVDMGRTIKGVEVSLLFREINPDKTKVTFRSKQYVDVQALAAVFGGGGHKRAAGATLLLPMDKTIEKILTLTKQALINDLKRYGSN